MIPCPAAGVAVPVRVPVGELVDDPPGDPHGGLLGDPLDGAPVQGAPLLDPDATDVETLAERVK